MEDRYANLKLGSGGFLFGASASAEFNDNVSYSDLNRQEDLILRPGMSMVGTVPLSEVNAFYATLDLGYAKYLSHPQYDRLVIQPGSQLAFDVYVKDFHFNLHDDIAVTEVPVAQGTISGAANYGEFANTAGLTADWDLNQAIASAGFDHQNSIATTSGFSYLDRQSENMVGRLSFQYSQALTAGPEASAGLTSYDRHLLNDSLNYSFGGFAVWQASAHITVRPRAGFTEFSFSSASSRPPVPDVRSYYFGVEMTHQINEPVEYALEAGRQIRLGINSELIDLWYVRPRLSWKLIDQVGLSAHLTCEYGTDNGSLLLQAAESYALLGAGISINYQLMEKALLGLSYDYSVKNSNLSGRDYHQNKIQVQLQYTF